MPLYIMRVHRQNILFYVDLDPLAALELGKERYNTGKEEEKDPNPLLFGLILEPEKYGLMPIPHPPPKVELAINDAVDSGPLADVDRRH